MKYVDSRAYIDTTAIEVRRKRLLVNAATV